MIYKNVISLGYWCGPALELRRIGFRSSSFPFDWLIIDLPEVVRCIEHDFAGFLEKENLAQYDDNPYYYIDIKTKTEFYHDFDGYKTFDSQYNDIYEKYKRRIERFYNTITEPTLFVRYLKNEDEVEYILQEISTISALLKTFNADNLIVFAGDEKYKKRFENSEVQFYPITNRENRKVVDDFLEASPALKQKIESSVVKPSSGIATRKRLWGGVNKRLKHKFLNPYKHSQIFVNGGS